MGLKPLPFWKWKILSCSVPDLNNGPKRMSDLKLDNFWICVLEKCNFHLGKPNTHEKILKKYANFCPQVMEYVGV